MADSSSTSTAPARPDLDIRGEIYDRMASYSPLMHDRHRLDIDVSDGFVTVKGYVKSEITRRYLVERVLPEVNGVTGIDATRLFDDDQIRRNVGHVIPFGVIVNTEYGAVILTGTLPEGQSIEALVNEIARVPGVHRVLTRLRSA